MSATSTREQDMQESIYIIQFIWLLLTIYAQTFISLGTCIILIFVTLPFAANIDVQTHASLEQSPTHHTRGLIGQIHVRQTDN
jgi:hypothetical protein